MIIGVMGKARSGKDQLAEYLISVFEKHGRKFAKMAFAEELKMMCMTAFKLDHDQLWGDRKEEETKFKKPGPPQGAAVTYGDGRGLPPWYWTPREIMQALGSFYRSIDYDYWVKQLDKSIRRLNESGYEDFIITDTRHINECEYVKDSGGFVIKLVRGGEQKIHGMSHESETALDNKSDNYFDMIIKNNGTLADLKVAADNICRAVIRLEKLSKDGGVYDGKE